MARTASVGSATTRKRAAERRRASLRNRRILAGELLRSDAGAVSVGLSVLVAMRRCCGSGLE